MQWQIGDIVLVRGDRWIVDDVTVWSDCSSLRFSGAADRSRSRTLLTPFDRPRRIEISPTVRPMRMRRWLHAVRQRAIGLTPLGGIRAVWRAPIRLFAYQIEPVLAVLRYGVTRMLIADGVGLGKTIQAGMILAELGARADELRALVLVPAGLRDQWAHELSSMFGLDAVQADAAWLRHACLERPPGENPWAVPGIYIVSIDFAKRPEVLHAIEGLSWDVVVMDEAHVATMATDRRAAANAAAARARRVVLLTATPHAGNPEQFDALCAIGRIDPSEPPLVIFRRSRADAAAGRPRRSRALPVSLSRAERRMHDVLDGYTRAVWAEAGVRRDAPARLAAIILKKRALSSAASLLASVQRRLSCLTGAEPEPAFQLTLPLDEEPLDDDVGAQALAAPGLGDSRREQQWLRSVAEAARHAARAESKIRVLARLIRRITEPLIVFTEYRDTLIRLERVFRLAGRSVIVLHGGLERAERTRVQRRFNAGGVCLLATDAASEGLNLHHECRLVVHYELPWSIVRLEQRVGRVDRLGQTRRVHELALIASGTTERVVLAPLMSRALRARRMGDTAGGLLDALTDARIADVVMQHDPLDIGEPPPLARSEVRSLDLRAEADRELERLERQRRWHARSGDGGAGGRANRPVAALTRSRRLTLVPGVYLTFVVSIEDSDRRRVHAESVVLHGSIAGFRGVSPAAASIRRIVAGADAASRTAGHVLHDTVAVASSSIEAAVAPLHRSRLSELQQRERLLAAPRSSTARTLVQPGLFDRRATRDAVRDHGVGPARLQDRSETTLRSGSDTVTTRVHLVAALIVDRTAPA
jgi:superfamily II DNA or RNA helicase